MRRQAPAYRVKTNIHDTRGNNLRFLALRREIQEGLNVIEHWNSVNDFILFGKSSEIATNRREDQELTMLAPAAKLAGLHQHLNAKAKSWLRKPGKTA